MSWGAQHRGCPGGVAGAEVGYGPGYTEHTAQGVPGRVVGAKASMGWGFLKYSMQGVSCGSAGTKEGICKMVLDHSE